MAVSATRTNVPDVAHPGAGPVDPSTLQQVILALVTSDGDTDSVLKRLLGLLVNLTGARAGTNFRRKDLQTPPELLHGFWPQELTPALPELPRALAQLADEVMSTGRAGVKPLKDISRAIPTDRWVGIGAPVSGADKAVVAICLVVDLGPQGRPEPYVALLQAVAACFQIHVLRRLGGAHQVLSQQMSVLLDAVGRSVIARNATEMAYFLTNELEQHLGCCRVAMGWWSRGRVKVVALSGQARFDKRGDTARAIRDAMAEAIRQEQSIVLGRAPAGTEPTVGASDPSPPDAVAVRPIDLAHRHLMDLCQVDHVLTYPLRSGQQIVGAWTFQWRKDRPPSAADERLIAVASGQVGPLIDWARRADQGVLRRAARTTGRAAAAIVGPRHLGAKAAVAGLVVLFAAMVFWKVPFRVGGDCTLQPTPRRYITARFDGVLKQAYVRPGEVVAQGQLLAELEDYQLRNELGKAKAEWHKAMKESDSFWSKGKLAEAQMARLEADKAQAQIDLLEFNLQHVKIAAPIDAVVLSGDLERARGVPVQRGQVLFELAPLAEMILEVAVPDADAAHVQPGQKGEFALQARPEQAIAFAVERVRPQAEVRNEKNVFVVEAPIGNAQGWLRPGMQGTAKIGVSDKPLGWVLTHRLVDWFRMRFWW